ncbi:MAG: hypothetical protein AAF621_04735, partial [Pseudomonadota bacterium]
GDAVSKKDIAQMILRYYECDSELEASSDVIKDMSTRSFSPTFPQQLESPKEGLSDNEESDTEEPETKSETSHASSDDIEKSKPSDPLLLILEKILENPAHKHIFKDLFYADISEDNFAKILSKPKNLNKFFGSILKADMQNAKSERYDILLEAHELLKNREVKDDIKHQETEDTTPETTSESSEETDLQGLQ